MKHDRFGDRRFIQFLGFCLIFLIASNVFGQAGPPGAITGTIKDPNGSVVAGAQLDVVNQETGVTARSTTSNASGGFTVDLLPIGNYKLVIMAQGFAKTEATNIKVSVTETTTVAISLKVGSLSEDITVTDAATTVDLSSATEGQVLTRETVGQLPLSTRNFLTLLTLSAGANTELADSTALGRGAVTINVNGQRPTNNNYQLEGINANDFNLPALDNVPLPNPQTVQEFKTQTSLYDASNGRNGGGNIQVALKSGTDRYHGDLFEFFRNQALNANDFFLNAADQSRPVLRQNQFGGSFGGPVPKVKNLFFFFNYQGTRAQSGISAGTTLSTTIPSLPTDRSAANLIATFFPQGLPQGFTQLDPVALKFLNLPSSKCPAFGDGTFCIPSLAGPAGGGSPLLSRSSLGTFDENQYTITVDKQLTTNDKLSGRVFIADFATLLPFGTSPSLSFPETKPNSNRFIKIGETHTLSSTMVNDFRFGFNRFTFKTTPTEPISLTDIGATRGNSADFPAAFEINVQSSFSLGTGVNDDRGGAFNTYVWGDDFSLTRNQHQFRFGGEIDRYQLNRFNNFATRGNVTFGPTKAGNGLPDLSSLQNFLLGRVTTTQGSAGFSTFHFRATDAAGYAQDDWKYNSRLTLNLGIRWEGLSTAHEKNDFLSNFLGNGDGTAGPITIIHPAGTPKVGTPGVSDCTTLHCFDWKNFGPRVGFAYNLFGDQKTVLRGGYGIYYDRISNQTLLQTSGGLPFSQAVSATPFSVTPENPFPTILPQSAFPLSADQVVPKLVGFNSATGAPIFNSTNGGPLAGFFFFPSRSLRAPYAQQWNLTVQRELFKSWVAEIGYVGTRGVRLLGPGGPVDAGQICTTAQPCMIPSAIGSGVNVTAGTPGVTKNSDGSISITQSTPDNVDARVPANFIGLANGRAIFTENGSQSVYHSLQASLVHRFSNDLYFQAAYTFSKSIDNASGSTFQDENNGLQTFGNFFDPRGNRGLSDFDRTHRLVFSYDYTLPIAKWTGITDQGFGKLANGWSINGVVTFQSGTPFIVVDSSAATLQDPQGINGLYFATLAPGKTLADALTSGSTEARLGQFINPAAFLIGGNCVNNQNVIVPCGSPSSVGQAQGNVGRNTFRGPFQQNWDMSFIKMTKLTESKTLEFRTEFFNVWNKATFTSPQAQGGFLGNYGIVDVGSSAGSAIITTANKPRIIQFALKLNF